MNAKISGFLKYSHVVTLVILKHVYKFFDSSPVEM